MYSLKYKRTECALAGMGWLSKIPGETVPEKIALILGVLFLFAGLGVFPDSVLAGVIAVATGLFLIPAARSKMLNIAGISLPRGSVLVVGVVGLMLFGAVAPSSPSTNTAPSTPSPDSSAQQTDQTSTDSGKTTTAEVQVINSSISPTKGATPLNVTGTLEVENVGNASGEFTVDVEVDSVYATSKTVEVTAGERRTITIYHTLDTPGQRTVSLVGYGIYTSATGEPDVDASATVIASVPEPDPLTLTGTGQEATDTFELEPGLSIYELSHTGSSNFQVWLMNNEGEKKELLVNRIGDFEGSNAVGLLGGQHLLDIEADGDWEITVRQPRPTSAPSPPRTYTGDSRKATGFFSTDGGLARFDMQHSGDGNFQVWLLDKDGTKIEMLANEIGEFEGSTATNLESGIYLLDVNANGDWTVSVE